jgi:undecaprenyl-diphosphatase
LSRAPTKERSHPTLLALGVAFLALGIFIRITQELLEYEVDAIDLVIILKVVAARSSWLNGVMRDVTSLGSVTLVVLFSIIAVAVFASLRKWRSALQVCAASVGSSLWTVIAKGSIERARPQAILQLVKASGYSYPSGHAAASASLYLTIALLLCRYVPSRRARVGIIAGAVLLILLVAFSRVYLGVHYPSDVAGGICVGVASALLVDLAFFHIRRLPRD